MDNTDFDKAQDSSSTPPSVPETVSPVQPVSSLPPVTAGDSNPTVVPESVVSTPAPGNFEPVITPQPTMPSPVVTPAPVEPSIKPEEDPVVLPQAPVSTPDPLKGV